MDSINSSVSFIKGRTDIVPRVAIILGSGLGGAVEFVQNKVSIDYEDIPGFPEATAQGHAGKLILGQVGETPVVMMQGRFHFYEGCTMQQVAYPVQVMRMLGAENLIVSCAAGGINPSFKPGDIMIMKDHLNFIGGSPLIGPNDERLGPRFFDMTEAYDLGLIEKAKTVAQDLGLSYQEGVHCAVTGPAYETAAEIRFFSMAGADSVSMSVVPEVLAGNHCGMRCLGMACITNMATGIATTKHTHEAVLDVAQKAADTFTQWVLKITEQL